jgi:arsenate reductase (thioredoxin)
MKSKVLFLCTHNSARSQMAEGLLRDLAGDRFESLSAGTEVTRVNPFAIEVMQELGIDLHGHRSKAIDEFAGETIDYLITVCDSAKEACPYFAGAKNRLHWSFPDPSAATGSDDEKRAVFREIRDQIAMKIAQFVEK